MTPVYPGTVVFIDNLYTFTSGAAHAKFYHKIELNFKSGLNSDVLTFFHSALQFYF